MPEWPREVPPTAGLPLRLRDLAPARGPSLEAALAEYLRVPEVQVECSGTAALVVALAALSRDSSRRSVVIPAYTCPLVALAVLRCGLEPVPCDLRSGHFDLSVEALRVLCGADTLAVVPTHLGGRVADLAAVTEVARRAGASVIEDAAQALGASWRGRPVGTVGDAGFHSLAVGKGLTIYEGGVLVARDAGLRRAFRKASREIAPYRPTWELRPQLALAGYAALYRPAALAFAYGLPLRRALRRARLLAAVGDDFSAEIPLHAVGAWRKAVGASAMRRLPAFLDALSALALGRKARLAAIPGVAVVDDTGDGRGIWPYFMVLMPTARARDAALSSLWSAGLGVSRLFIHALPDYPYLASRLRDADVDNARDFAARLLTVSNSPWLEERAFHRVCDALGQAGGVQRDSSDSKRRFTR